MPSNILTMVVCTWVKTAVSLHRNRLRSTPARVIDVHGRPFLNPNPNLSRLSLPFEHAQEQPAFQQKTKNGRIVQLLVCLRALQSFWAIAQK